MIWRDEYLTRSVVVQPDGYIAFPLIGEVPVSGRTIPEIREEVGRRLKEYLPDVQLSVLPKQINSYFVYVIGRVKKPGEYKLSHTVTVVQALAMAESFDDYASPSDIRILRKSGSGFETLPFNYNQVEKGKNLEQNVELQSGDVVIVP